MPRIVIESEATKGVLDLHELWLYRDTLYFLVRRNIRIRYAQSVLGIGWALINPLFQMLIFTAIFGGLIRVSSDGVPYAVFSYAALVPWGYFSGALTGASMSMINATNMINKVYFPRMILPLTPVFEHLIDFAIAFLLLIVMMIFTGSSPTLGILILPVLIVIMMVAATGLGMLLAALAVQYRDVAYAMGFGITVLMYLSPVIYPTNLLPQHLRVFYGLNPMVGVIEGFRSALLNTNPMPWDLVLVGAFSTVILFVIGTFYFHRREHLFADVA